MLKITISSPRTAPVGLGHGCRIAIIGGGFTGATVARLLAERSYRHVDEITVFEPREGLGSGLAYDVGDPDLRLNVAAHRMRAVPGAPSAFLDWLQASGALSVDPQAIAAEGIYARRRDFGRFMREQMAAFLDDDAIRHVRERVVSVRRRRDRWHVTGASGTSVTADILILATGHPPASIPEALGRTPHVWDRVIADVWRTDAFDRVNTGETVLVVGSGLTALDAVARLSARRHRGKILLLSRSGLLPRPHASGDFSPYGDFLAEPPATARILLRKVRSTIADAQDKGIPWQSVFDALRQQAQSLWHALPPAEKRKLLRRLRRWYDVHRFRMPPQVSQLLRSETVSARVGAKAGNIRAVRRQGERLAVTVAAGTDAGVVDFYDRIILATGPDFRRYCEHQRWLHDLDRDGVLRSDPLGLGLACDTAGRALAADGCPSMSLFVAGPPARAAFGELTGVPEIAAQASKLVDGILRMRARDTRTIRIRGM